MAISVWRLPDKRLKTVVTFDIRTLSLKQQMPECSQTREVGFRVIENKASSFSQ
jgi:hypothetical protein